MIVTSILLDCLINYKRDHKIVSSVVDKNIFDFHKRICRLIPDLLQTSLLTEEAESAANN
jgi:hypothetical protein